MSETIMITGVAGFLGRAIAKQFRSAGCRVCGVDIVTEENAHTATLDRYACISLPSVELADFIAQERPSTIVHCAGRASVPLSFETPHVDYENGPAITAGLLETIRTVARETKFIFCSSAAVYGEPLTLPISELSGVQPISPYGYNKRQSELLCEMYSRCFGVPTAVMRIFSAYGVGLRRQVIYEICAKSVMGEIVVSGTGDETRDFVHSLDVANATVAIWRNAQFIGEIYNVSNAREVSIREIVDTVRELCPSNIPARFLAREQKGMPQRWLGSNQKLIGLGYSPEVTLKEGIKSVLDACRAEAYL